MKPRFIRPLASLWFVFVGLSAAIVVTCPQVLAICAGSLSPVPFEQMATQIQERLRQIDEGPMQLSWSLKNPREIRRNKDGEWELAYRRKPYVNYVFEARGDKPFQKIHRMFGYARNTTFFTQLYETYGATFDPELLKVAEASENLLNPLNEDLAEVRSPTKKFGTLRVYDGSEDPLPFEILLEQRNLRAKFSEDLEKIRKRKGKIFELGKFTLAGSAKQREAAFNAIEIFLDRHYIHLYPEALFVLHVVTPAHRRHFEGRYSKGMKCVESVDVGRGFKEHILVISAAEFSKAIRGRLVK